MSLASVVADGFVTLSNALKQRGFPRAGAVGQVVTKTGAADFDFAWQNPPAGGGGPKYVSNVTFRRRPFQ